MGRQENDHDKYCLPYCVSHLAPLAFAMAPNEEPASDTSATRVSSHSPPNETPARPDSQNKKGQTDKFSHPGAKIIAQRAADGDGLYRCRKCGDAVLTVSVKQCPACLDEYPWFASADDEEHA